MPQMKLKAFQSSIAGGGRSLVKKRYHSIGVRVGCLSQLVKSRKSTPTRMVCGRTLSRQWPDMAFRRLSRLLPKAPGKVKLEATWSLRGGAPSRATPSPPPLLASSYLNPTRNFRRVLTWRQNVTQ